MANASGAPVPLSISSEHPALPGHFPGSPVVPGVVILDLIIQTLLERYPAQRIQGIRKIKFLRPLAPDEVFLLQSGEPQGDSLRFKCHLQDSGQLLAEGNLVLGVVAQHEPPVA